MLNLAATGRDFVIVVSSLHFDRAHQIGSREWCPQPISKPSNDRVSVPHECSQFVAKEFQSVIFGSVAQKNARPRNAAHKVTAVPTSDLR